MLAIGEIANMVAEEGRDDDDDSSNEEEEVVVPKLKMAEVREWLDKLLSLSPWITSKYKGTTTTSGP